VSGLAEYRNLPAAIRQMRVRCQQTRCRARRVPRDRQVRSNSAARRVDPVIAIAREVQNGELGSSPDGGAVATVAVLLLPIRFGSGTLATAFARQRRS